MTEGRSDGDQVSAPAGAGAGAGARGSNVSARWRVVGWLMLTSALGLTTLVLTVHSTLRAAVEREANEDVTQELREFRQLADGGRDPETAEPFASTGRLLEVFLSRQNPGTGEFLVGEIEGSREGPERYGPGTGEARRVDLISRPELREAMAGGHSGVLQTEVGEVRWGTVDVAG